MGFADEACKASVVENGQKSFQQEKNPSIAARHLHRIPEDFGVDICPLRHCSRCVCSCVSSSATGCNRRDSEGNREGPNTDFPELFFGGYCRHDLLEMHAGNKLGLSPDMIFLGVELV